MRDTHAANLFQSGVGESGKLPYAILFRRTATHRRFIEVTE
jgi:hypothetical protein